MEKDNNMANIRFNKAIKYNGVKYPAHSVVNVDEIDVEAIMKDLGGHLIIDESKKEEAVKQKKK